MKRIKPQEAPLRRIPKPEITLHRISPVKSKKFPNGALVKITNPKFKYCRFRVLRCYKNEIVIHRRGVSSRSSFTLYVKKDKVYKVNSKNKTNENVACTS